jgi:hypothetical protein
LKWFQKSLSCTCSTDIATLLSLTCPYHFVRETDSSGRRAVRTSPNRVKLFWCGRWSVKKCRVHPRNFWTKFSIYCNYFLIYSQINGKCPKVPRKIWELATTLLFSSWWCKKLLKW